MDQVCLLLLPALAVVMAGVLVLLRANRREIQRMQQGSCWKCGYDLRGQNTRRCPECGTSFDPDEFSRRRDVDQTEE